MKKWLYCALEDLRSANGTARFCGLFLIALICANALLVFVPQQIIANTPNSSLPALGQLTAALASASAVAFFAEYCARIWIADMIRPQLAPSRARLRYLLSPMGIIDLLAFLPTVLAWFLPVPAGFISIVILLRLVRLVKITRYMRGMHTITRVIRRRRHEIIASFMVLGLMAVIASVLMYEVEHAAQPEKFDSVLTGMYWAVTTMSSTGYGDLTPITPLGRLIGWLLMVLSIALVAIPGGIFSAGFVEEFRESKELQSDESAQG